MPEALQLIKETDAILMLTHELFGEAPLAMETMPHGQVNRVYEVDTKSEGRLVYQLHSDKTRVNLFYRGNWAMDLARERGIPVPRVIATGNALVPYAYLIYKKIEGVPAVEFAGDTAKIAHELAVYAKRINLIDAPGYGKVGHWKGSHREYYETWGEYVRNELVHPTEGLWANDGLLMDAASRSKLLDRMRDLESWDVRPKLIHGDLVLKNTIVDDGGKIVGVIDWDEANFGKAPEQELAAAFLWTDASYQGEFLSGYGISGQEWERMRPRVETFQILKLLEYHAWNRRIGDHSAAEPMRQRLLSML